MKELNYRATIAAPAKTVWNKMIGQETYKEWTGVAWPGSGFEGEWKLNGELKFTGSDGSGTRARITDFEENKLIVANHIALLLPGGAEDRDSDFAKTWVGSIEQYAFNESNGTTELVVTMHINEKWEDMFNNDWPKALTKLKEMSEA